MDVLVCYENIIGLSRTECDCFDPKPANYDTSKSGFFLDELVNLHFVRDLEDCDESRTMWELMDTAREQGILKFQTDMNSILTKNYEINRSRYTGSIGRTRNHKLIRMNEGDYGIVRLRPVNVRGANMILTQIGCTFEKTGTIEVEVYTNDGAKIGETLLLETIGGRHKQNNLSTPIILPLFDEYNKDLEYLVTYQYTDNRPYENAVDCGCGVKFRFDTRNPYTLVGLGKRAPMWTKYVMVGGEKRTSLENLNDLGTTALDNMMGLTFGVKLSCDFEIALCDTVFEMENNMLARSIALAIRYAAGDWLIAQILRDPKLTRATMVQSETLEDSRKECIKGYNEYIGWIGQNVHIEEGCLTCRDDMKMEKSMIK